MNRRHFLKAIAAAPLTRAFPAATLPQEPLAILQKHAGPAYRVSLTEDKSGKWMWAQMQTYGTKRGKPTIFVSYVQVPPNATAEQWEANAQSLAKSMRRLIREAA